MAAPAGAEAAMAGPSLLIVEDNPVNMLVLNLMLKDRGYTVAEARDGIEAVELATSEKPEIILMDIMMPRMDGITAAREILGRARDKPPKIVAVTGNALESITRECLEAGFAAVLLKPVDARELIATISRLLGGGGGCPAH